MPIEMKLCDCGCGQSRLMTKGGKFYEPYCRVRNKRKKDKAKKEKELNNLEG